MSNTAAENPVTVKLSGGEAGDTAALRGVVMWEKRSGEGVVTSRGEASNIVTQVGDQMYGERGAGVTGAVAGPVGMKLGTGSTAATKTGAGAAVVTYLSGSNQVFDGGFPTSILNTGSRRIGYRVTYAAGTATSATPVTEVVIFTDGNANANSSAANTAARAIIAPGAKAAGDSLTITWYHDLTGS